MKKLNFLFSYRSIAVFFCILATVSLFFPIYSARTELESAFIVTIHGFNLAEFSGFGGIVITTPFLLAALLLCNRLSASIRTVCLFILTMACSYALPAALFEAKQYLTINVGSFSRHSGLSFFISLLIAAVLLALASISENACTAIAENT